MSVYKKVNGVLVKTTDSELPLTQTQLEATNSGITSAKVSKLDALPTSTQLNGSLSSKANKSDITNISITGSTNNTGSNILAGTLFYLNGTLCKTLVDVANGATFTEGTNYSTWSLKNTQDMVNDTAKSDLKNLIDITHYNQYDAPYTIPSDGYIALNSNHAKSGIGSATIYGSGTSIQLSCQASPTVDYVGNCVFVKKGMRVVAVNLPVGFDAWFVPLS